MNFSNKHEFLEMKLPTNNFDYHIYLKLEHLKLKRIGRVVLVFMIIL